MVRDIALDTINITKTKKAKAKTVKNNSPVVDNETALTSQVNTDALNNLDKFATSKFLIQNNAVMYKKSVHLDFDSDLDETPTPDDTENREHNTNRNDDERHFDDRMDDDKDKNKVKPSRRSKKKQMEEFEMQIEDQLFIAKKLHSSIYEVLTKAVTQYETYKIKISNNTSTFMFSKTIKNQIVELLNYVRIFDSNAFLLSDNNEKIIAQLSDCLNDVKKGRSEGFASKFSNIDSLAPVIYNKYMEEKKMLDDRENLINRGLASVDKNIYTVNIIKEDILRIRSVVTDMTKLLTPVTNNKQN